MSTVRPEAPCIYLDNAATTRVAPEVASAMARCFEVSFGNPSSAHRLGIEADRLVKSARETVASVLHAEPDEILFVSGGTEADGLAVLGGARRVRRPSNGSPRHVVISALEHPAVAGST